MSGSQNAKEFQEKGFIILKNFYDEKTIDHLNKRISEFRSSPEDNGRLVYTELTDGKSQLCRIEYFALQDEFIRDVILEPLTTVCNDVMGEAMILFKDKINFKLPGGSGFTPHQDGAAYVFDANYVSVSIAVDRSTLENGCLWVAPGEHTRGQLPHPKGQLDPDAVKDMKFHPVIMNPGDVMVFHNHLPHYSEANRSDESRTIIYLTLSSAKNGDLRETYYSEKLEKFPPKHMRVPGKDYSEGAAIYNLSNPIE